MSHTLPGGRWSPVLSPDPGTGDEGRKNGAGGRMGGHRKAAAALPRVGADTLARLLESI